MSRAGCLPYVPFGHCYVYRKAAHNRRLLRDPRELASLCRLLAFTRAKHGVLLHFARGDRDEIHLGGSRQRRS